MPQTARPTRAPGAHRRTGITSLLALGLLAGLTAPVAADEASPTPEAPVTDPSVPTDDALDAPSEPNPADVAVGVRVIGDTTVEVTWQTPNAVVASVEHWRVDADGAPSRMVEPAVSTVTESGEHRHTVVLGGLECATDHEFVAKWLHGEDTYVTAAGRFRTPICVEEPGVALAPRIIARQTSATVIWQSAEPGRGAVAIGETSDFETAAGEPEQYVSVHEILVGGLTCETEYHFVGLSESLSGDVTSTDTGSFATAPCSPSDEDPTTSDDVGDEPAGGTDDVELIEIPTVESPRGPTLMDIAVSDVSKTTATITWSTDVDALASIVHGATVEYGNAVYSGSVGTEHAVQIGELQCGSTYHYSPLATDAEGVVMNGGPGSFSTQECDAAEIIDMVVAGGERSLILTWSTDLPADALVLYGPTTGYEGVLHLPEHRTTHSIDVPDLACGTEYHIRIVADSGVGTPDVTDDDVATTEPCSREPVTVADPDDGGSI